MATTQKALIVEDHPQVIYTVKPILQALHFHVDAVRTLSAALKKLLHCSYDIIILDRTLPDGDGLDLFKTIEGVESNARVLVVSARASSEDRTLGLLRGADDYLSKPFASAELSARIQSLMKRTKDLCIGVREIYPGMLYDFSQHRLHNGEDERQFTPGEARLFELFMRHKLHQLSRKVIESCMWTSDQYPTSTAVDVCVKRLRDRMHDLPITIKTVRGTGYALRFSRFSSNVRQIGKNTRA